MSSTMFGTELPKKNLLLSKQLPPTRYGMYAFSIGEHWKSVTRIVTSHRTPAMVPRIYTPVRMNRVGTSSVRYQSVVLFSKRVDNEMSQV